LQTRGITGRPALFLFLSKDKNRSARPKDLADKCLVMSQCPRISPERTLFGQIKSSEIKS
jgi:hypothetical protein